MVKYIKDKNGKFKGSLPEPPPDSLSRIQQTKKCLRQGLKTAKSHLPTPFPSLII